MRKYVKDHNLWKEILKKPNNVEIKKREKDIKGRTNQATIGGMIGLTTEGATKMPYTP